MSKDQNIKLRDFVAWVRHRKPVMSDAPINDETIEYVTKGIERFLQGESPWPEPRGNKSKPDLTWEAYWMINFDEVYKSLHNRRHTETGGLYAAVAGALCEEVKTVESRVRTAVEKLETTEGIIDFCRWVAKKQKVTIVSYKPAPKKKAKLITPDSLTSSTATNTAASAATVPADNTWSAMLSKGSK